MNLMHRGACGCEANTGDGAGILIQMPDRFFRDEAARLGIALPAERALRRRPGVPAARSGRPRARSRRSSSRSSARKASASSAGATCRSTSSTRRPERRRGRAGVPAVLRRPRRGPAVGGQVDRGRCALRAQALRHPQARRARGRRARPAGGEKRFFYVVSLSSNTLIYKGMLTADQLGPMFPDLLDPRLESALALVHQRFSTNTFPSLAARAPVPLPRPQRRDQHAARQPQLDARARGAAAVGRVRRRAREDVPDPPRGRQRLGDARQRARAAGAWRAARCRTRC